jgi:hypothetical protein
MNDWKETYPYLLDAPLSEAIKIATKNGDSVRAKQLWDILVSYRKAENWEGLEVKK